jgi:5-(carboxyamino)imidazole ribonucleotide synthase
MKKAFNTLKVGILGGGQLGRMLLQKSADFSLHMRVLDPDPAAPCRYLCDEFVNGSFKDFDTVYTFGKSCDLVTIEIEHVNVEALEKLEHEGIMVFPQPHVIRIVQDKGLQKMFFRDHNIPTADFELIDDAAGLSSLNISFPIMQKLRKGGYDGKGVVRVSGQDDFGNAFTEPSVAEKLIPFKKEIAVIVARNIKGEIKTFPAVDMEFNPEANLVEFLFSPAELSAELENKAAQIAIQVAEALKIVGVLAVEMFLTEDDRILVNEIAPRPHNSGHHTIEANIVSQYEQHLRAILGLPLGDTNSLQHAVMVNLLGEKGHDGIAHYQAIEETLSIPGVYVHLYGKKFTRPFRKMGHVTVTGHTKDEAVSKALQVKKLLKVISD